MIGRQKRGDDARHGRGTADGEIDSPGYDDEGHAQRDQREHGVVTQEAQDVVLRQEVLVTQRSEQDEAEERQNDAEAGHIAGGLEGKSLED